MVDAWWTHGGRMVDAWRMCGGGVVAVVGAHAGAHGPDDRIWEDTIAPFFGLWHSVPYIRGVHDGVHRYPRACLWLALFVVRVVVMDDD